MAGLKKINSLYAGCATVFFSSACIMLIELSAGRLAAQDIGSSLYTWTAVIVAVLAGMTVGNYAGGRIADRFRGKRVIAGLFGIASITCVGAIVLDNRVGTWGFLWRLSWPAYVLTYITITFLLPPLFLGAISPVIAKTALESQQKTGRTIGDIYAFGAAGSIAGTFFAGFWLIPAIGPTGVIWTTAAALLVAGLIYSPMYRLLQLWAVMLGVLVFLGMGSARWAEETGALLTLRNKPDPNVIYEDETQYCRIYIKQESKNPDKRSFYQDKLRHSKIVMEDITDLQYDYARIYAAVTEQAGRGNDNPTFLAIGGGGFVFPRYLKHLWPASRVDVAEIDPGVTKAAMAAFGLPNDHSINIFTMDGRNFIDGLIAKSEAGDNVPRYDFVYGDAYDNFSVPYQLVTREFNEKVSRILKEDGFYLLNLIDIYDSGLVIGSVLNTLRQTFGHVYILAPEYDCYGRATFVLIASRRTLDIDSLVSRLGKYYRNIWHLSAAELDTLTAKCGEIILTDKYCPIDNLAAPIAARSGSAQVADIYITEAQRMKESDRWDRTVELYMKAIRTYPPLTTANYQWICKDLLAHREFEETVFVCEKALQYYDKPGIRNDISSIHLNMGAALKALGQIKESQRHIGRAIEGYNRRIERDPNDADALSNLGMAIAQTSGLAEAIGYFERAVKTAPSNPEYRLMLAETLISQKNYAGAQAAIKDAIAAMKQAGNKEAVLKLQRLLERISYEVSQPK
jgi:tetratricopeptide (TPR) repeat protein/MFS family permease